MHVAHCPRCKRSLALFRSDKIKKDYITPCVGNPFFVELFMWITLAACMMTFLTVYIALPPLCALSWRMGAVDVPRDARRMHRSSVPRCGGLGIFFAFLIGVLLTWGGEAWQMRLLAGAWMLLAVGLTDDIYTVGPWTRLLVQGLAAAMVVEPRFVWGDFARLLWILLLCNAHNLIDGMDGLLAGCVTVECIAVCGSLLINGEDAFALTALLLGAACAGFWIYNRHPAVVFAGDCGSCTVGYLLGALSLRLWELRTTPFTPMVPLLIFAYPLTDVFCAVARRLLRGKSPFSADRGHLHHRLFDAGVAMGQCVRLLHTIVGMSALLGVLLAMGDRLWWSSAAAALFALLLIVVKKRVLQDEKNQKKT